MQILLSAMDFAHRLLMQLLRCWLRLLQAVITRCNLLRHLQIMQSRLLTWKSSRQFLMVQRMGFSLMLKSAGISSSAALSAVYLALLKSKQSQQKIRQLTVSNTRLTPMQPFPHRTLKRRPLHPSQPITYPTQSTPICAVDLTRISITNYLLDLSINTSMQS
ncbi:unannotated protein [freshwater metagenome]|uniref:Unannotated protein n=1 Tax=freshwater metagenome TaxID=449393 RepID=A0A6J6SAG3_9ZZZZ